MCICLCIYNKFERRPFQVITIINDNLLNQFRYMLAHPCWHDYRSTKKACAILESFHIVSYLLFLAVVLSCSFTSLDAQPVFVPISPIKGEMNRVNFFTIKTWLDCLSSHIKIRNVVISFTTHFFSFFPLFVLTALFTSSATCRAQKLTIETQMPTNIAVIKYTTLASLFI